MWSFPSTLKRIGDYAFRGYGGDDLNLPEGLEYIGEGAFIYTCPTQDLIIPEGVKEIGPSAFASMVWTSNVFLPSTLEKLDEECFKSQSDICLYGWYDSAGDCGYCLCRMQQSE